MSTGVIACREGFTANPELSPKFVPTGYSESYICLLSDSELIPTNDERFLEVRFVKRLWNVCDGQRRFRFSAFKSSSVFKVLEGFRPRSELAFVEPAYQFETSMSINDFSKRPVFIGFFAHFENNPCKYALRQRKSALLKPLFYKGLRAFCPENA